MPGCEYFALFCTVPWLAWSPRLTQNTPITELFSKKNHVLLSNFFSSSNMFFIRLFLANTWKKIGCHRACFLTDCRVERSWSGWRICAVGTGTRHKMVPIVFEVCTRYQANSPRLFFHRNSYLEKVQKQQRWGKSRFDEILKLRTFGCNYL